ncbi:MAG: glycine zipper family protein, partial [Acetobacteraceae bacterium]
MRRIISLVVPTTALALSSCAVAPPPGPSVMALPGQGKNFQAFQQDDVACRQYASQQTGGASPDVAATNSAVGSAVVGTALG